MGFLSSVFGREAEIKTKEITDPKKQAVASPLSSFLSSEVGQGVPRFGGNILSELPEGGGASVSDFLKLNPDQLFEERIKGPALQTFREDLLPLVREEFAGSLSGSGRFRTEEEAASRFTRSLAETRANLELQLPEAQSRVSSLIKEQRDKEAVLQYNDWLKSLPQFNPVLEQSLRFLQESTNTGSTILTALDPGSEGILGDLLGSIATMFALRTGKPNKDGGDKNA